MIKIMNAIFCLIALAIATETRAVADNLKLTQYKNASDVPSAYLSLGGGLAMARKAYKDDEGNDRQDKVYYTTTHSYDSSFRAEDIAKMLNPSDGRLGSLFEETSVNKSSRPGFYDVMMKISTPIKDFDCASTLSFKNVKIGNKNVFIYTFTNFNMVFTDMVIQIDLENVNGTSKIRLTQIAAIKGTTYTKLKNFFAVGKFEKALKENIRKLKDGVGGI